MSAAEPKRGTLEIYRVARCKNCWHRIVSDHNTSFEWRHDETYMVSCQR